MNKVWQDYQRKLYRALYTYALFILAYLTAHVVSVRFHLKESVQDIFGSLGIENFVLISLSAIFIGTFIRTYFKIEDL